MISNPYELSSFGTLLKAFRTRKRLTQQQLAQAIGVHRHAIGRWEQGDFLPATRGMVLELARHLILDESETRQLLEASLTALSPYWLMPFPRNPFFTGREEILDVLHTQLGVNRAVALTQSSALHGLGGVGKTQIALEYAYRHALDYSAVFWIGAETEEQMVSSLLRIAEVLQLPERDHKEQQQIVTAVQRWFATHSQWLVICDNVEELELVRRFLPATRSGAMLITTRCRTLGTFARGLDLLPMEQEEGTLFLLRRAKILAPEATSEQVRQIGTHVPIQYTVAADLVTALGGLPLALDQAGAYLETTQCGLPAYLDLFRTRRAVLLQQRGEGIRDHPASVSTTFTLAILETTQRDPVIWDLLCICALLQSDAIPEELFRQGSEHLGEALQAVCRDVLEWDRIIAIACGYSLLSRQPETQTLSLHRLVQAVLLDTMTERERPLWSRRAIEALDAVFPDVESVKEYATWKQRARLLPHTLLCLHRTGADSESLPLASLAYKAAQYLREHGRYAEAEPLFQRALQIREHLLGSEHALVAEVLFGLALLRDNQEQSEMAESLYLRAAHIGEQTPGTEPPVIGEALTGLASLYANQGKYVEAELSIRRALDIQERTMGAEHPQVVTSLNVLATLFSEQGKYAEAKPIFQRTLRVREQTLGAEHPDVAIILNNLAELAREQGSYVEAESFYQRALHILEQAQGPARRRIPFVLYNQAELAREQGNYVEAESFYQRSLPLLEQDWGPNHSNVAYSLIGLANLYREQGNYAEAEALYQRALSIREQHLGQCHPATAQSLHDLAVFRQKQGNLNEAISLAERVLHIRIQSLGDTHPQTVATQMLSAQLLQQQEASLQAASDPYVQKRAETPSAEHRTGKISRPLPGAGDQSSPVNDPLQGFLDACCELHPRAWCRSADLWDAYTRWVKEQQEPYPLSRSAFIAQLKRHGCRAGRTMSARIWRGVALVKNEE